MRGTLQHRRPFGRRSAPAAAAAAAIAVFLSELVKATEPSPTASPKAVLLASDHDLPLVCRHDGGTERRRAQRGDLARNPENGWSLYGLAASLDAQGRKDEAAAAEKRFRTSWARADVPLKASVF